MPSDTHPLEQVPWGLLAGLSLGAALCGFAPSLLALQIFERVIPSGHSGTLLVLVIGAILCLLLSLILDLARHRLLENWAARRMVIRGANTGFTLKPVLPSTDALLTPLDGLSSVLAIFLLMAIAPVLGAAAVTLASLIGLVGLLISRQEQEATRAQSAVAQVAADWGEAAPSYATAAPFQRSMAPRQSAGWAGWLRVRSSLRVKQCGLSGLRSLTPTLAMGLGAVLVLRGDMGPGGMIACSIFLARAIAPFGALATGIQQWRALFRSDEDGLIPAQRQGPPAGIAVTDLVLRDHRGLPLLAVPHLQLSPGERVAVIGPPGSGKSRLGNAIAGLGGKTAALGLDGGPVRIALVSGATPLPPLSLDQCADPAGRLKGLILAVDLGPALAALQGGWHRPVNEVAALLGGTDAILLRLVVALSLPLDGLVIDGALDALDPDALTKVQSVLGQATDDGLALVLLSNRPSLVKAFPRGFSIQGGRLRPLGGAALSVLKGQSQDVSSIQEGSGI